jgi:predicted acetyltransferase
MTDPVRILKPSPGMLPAYIEALERGWNPDNVRGRAGAADHLSRISEDAAAFLASLDDEEAKGPDYTAPDGTKVKRLPGFVRWIWDGTFCGMIGFRWQKGTSELPPHVLGHIGYTVVEWKRGRGYATEALRQLLPECRKRGLTYVELTTDPDNIPSHKVITSNGGKMLRHEQKPAAYGGGDSLRWRIDL